MELASELKPSELALITEISKSTLSRTLAKVPGEITTKNNRVIGIAPELAEQLISEKLPNIKKSSIMVLANCCGGVSKTSATIALALASRRLTSRKKALYLLDSDPQGSMSIQLTSSISNNLTLVDYIEGKCKLEEIIEPLSTEDNVFIIKSNLNNIFLDKSFNVQKIKSGMLGLFREIEAKNPNGFRLFMDTSPQLSALLSSTVIALAETNSENIIAKLMIPLRSDPVALNGGRLIINESHSILNAFNIPTEKLKTIFFFSALDNRIKKTTSEIYKTAITTPEIANHLSPVAIKYSTELIKSSMNQTTIYHPSAQSKNVQNDYTELFLEAISKE
jgi:cellulose biosynthesis protein BcsQ